MITDYMMKEILEGLNKPKQPSHIFKEHKGKIIVYATEFPQYRAIGRNEKEALINLRDLYANLIKSKEQGN